MRDHLAQPTLSLDTARAAICDPARAVAHPWKVQDAWFALKEAQGCPIGPDALLRLTPVHLTGTDLPPSAEVIDLSWGGAHVAEQIEPHRKGALAKVRAIIARGTGPTGGDAA
jgi:hypothetical protein